MNKLVKYVLTPLALILEKWCEFRGRTIKIFGRPGEPDADKIYLVRYYLFKEGSPWQIYLHRFMRSDHDVPHDHPFDFISFVLTKGYKEQVIWREDSDTAFWSQKYLHHKPGSMLIRQAQHAHKVIIDGKYDWEDRKKAPLTMIIRSPRYRSWGFLPMAKGSVNGMRCIRNWKDWREYLNINEEDVNKEAI